MPIRNLWSLECGEVITAEALLDKVAGLRRAATAKKQGGTVRLKTAPKSENKTYDHFTPISGQASALEFIN